MAITAEISVAQRAKHGARGSDPTALVYLAMEPAQIGVFLSYNSADAAVIEELANRLRREGTTIWMDSWNLTPGDPWLESIEKALTSASCCVVCVGASGIGRWQNEEMRLAIDRRVETRGSAKPFRLIPVLLPGLERPRWSDLPRFLTAVKWVEFNRDFNDEIAFERLLAGIRGREPGQPPAPVNVDCPYVGVG